MISIGSALRHSRTIGWCGMFFHFPADPRGNHRSPCTAPAVAAATFSGADDLATLKVLARFFLPEGFQVIPALGRRLLFIQYRAREKREERGE